MAYPHKWSPISYKSSAGQRKHIGQRPMLYRWTTPPTNVGNVCNLVNVGRWRNGHTLRTLRENMETNFTSVSDSYWSSATASTWKIEIDSIPTDFRYTWLFCRIRENVYVKIFTYTWFSTLPTLTTYVTWRWKSRVILGQEFSGNVKVCQEHMSLMWNQRMSSYSWRD